MSYADILVQIDETKTSHDRAAFAAATAGKWGATLTGVFVKSEYPAPVYSGEYPTYPTPMQVEAMAADHETAVMAASEKAREIFERAAADARVTSDWRVIQDDDVDPLVQAARRSDLAIMPPRAKILLSQRSVSAANIALGSGGPVILFPDDANPMGAADRILVAWNGSRESARALRDAMPYLRAAREVRVLVVDPDDDDPDSALQRHLERNGCRAEVVVERTADGAAGPIIRRQATAMDADLIVMGLYGHSRVRELVLGGVSRDLLRHTHAPLLLSH